MSIAACMLQIWWNGSLDLWPIFSKSRWDPKAMRDQQIVVFEGCWCGLVEGEGKECKWMDGKWWTMMSVCRKAEKESVLGWWSRKRRLCVANYCFAQLVTSWCPLQGTYCYSKAVKLQFCLATGANDPPHLLSFSHTYTYTFSLGIAGSWFVLTHGLTGSRAFLLQPP